MLFTTILLFVSGFQVAIDPRLGKKNVVDSDPILIQNNFVTCYSDRLVIDYYYFPFGSKTIKYSDIQSCKLIGQKDLSFFETKLWGMTFSPIWWHLDLRRQWRQFDIILDTNQWPKIGITMNDNDTIKVYNLIKQKINLNK